MIKQSTEADQTTNVQKFFQKVQEFPLGTYVVFWLEVIIYN